MLVFSAYKANMLLEPRAIVRATPIGTSRGAPKQWEMSPHTTPRKCEMQLLIHSQTFYWVVFGSCKTVNIYCWL